MRYPHERAHRELAALARPPERRVGARLLKRLDAGDASLERFVLRPQGCRVAIGLGCRRDGAVRELVGPLLQNPGGRSADVPEYRPAFGGDRLLSDHGGAKRRRVQPARVTVTAAHQRRSTSGDPIETGRGWPAAPVVLVEPPAGEPLARRELARPASDQVEGRFDRLRVAEMDLRHLKAPPAEVHARVEPARRHQATTQIHALGGPRVPPELGLSY